MKNTILVLAAVLAPALRAGMTLSSVSGGVATPVGVVYDFGQVAAGDAKDARFRIRNTGTASLDIITLRVFGAGFSIVNTSSTPYTIAPGDVMEAYVRFFSPTAGNFSGTLQVNDLKTTLQATAVPSAGLTVASPCTGPDANLTLSFGRIQQGTQQSCIFSLQNPYNQTLTISPLSVTGAGFELTPPPSVTLIAGQTMTFTVTFRPTAASAYFGSLTVGSRTYTLAGVGYLPPLPPPILTFDSTTFASNEQHTLSVKLPSPSSYAATGTITITFKPASPAVSDDSAVRFVATGKRVASFAIPIGGTALTINNQPDIVFSTGTTAGTITFAIDAGIYGAAGSPVSITVAPAPIAITQASATSRTGSLDVVVTGFDNTYTAGAMSFTFYDRGGGVIASGIQADFTPNFQAFYKGQTAGSAFLMRVTFPVTGDVAQVGSVAATLNNSAGSVTRKLAFP
jgi:hypothetical protein